MRSRARIVALCALASFAHACAADTDSTPVDAEPFDAASLDTTGLRADGCPTYDPAAGPCDNTIEGKACWYELQCDLETGTLQLVVCEKNPQFEAEFPYIWRLTKFCVCPKDATPDATCD